MSALSPAKVEKIVVSEEENEVTAIVPDYQLSLAIGKEGQNVRLAAKLCGVKIDIKSHTQYYGDPQVTVSLGGELDDEGYLNPDDFMTDDDTEKPDAEDSEAIAVETADEDDAVEVDEPVASDESVDSEEPDEPSEEAVEDDGDDETVAEEAAFEDDGDNETTVEEAVVEDDGDNETAVEEAAVEDVEDNETTAEDEDNETAGDEAAVEEGVEDDTKGEDEK
jgi:N utilization substance protein A